MRVSARQFERAVVVAMSLAISATPCVIQAQWARPPRYWYVALADSMPPIQVSPFGTGVRVSAFGRYGWVPEGSLPIMTTVPNQPVIQLDEQPDVLMTGPRSFPAIAPNQPAIPRRYQAVPWVTGPLAVALPPQQAVPLVEQPRLIPAGPPLLTIRQKAEDTRYTIVP